MLYRGNVSTTEEHPSRKSRLINTSAADAVFCCPWVNSSLGNAGKLIFGFAKKSMTGSKKVLTLMNHYGHCTSSETM